MALCSWGCHGDLAPGGGIEGRQLDDAGFNAFELNDSMYL